MEQWQRFVYWLNHADDYGSALEGLAGVVMLIITIMLLRQTRESMKAAVDSARASEAAAAAAKQQIAMMVYPNVTLELREIGWTTFSVGKQFLVTAVVHNLGSFPVRINKAVLSWQCENTGKLNERDMAFRYVVIPPGGEIEGKTRLFSDKEYQPQHEPSLTDFVQLKVECSDLNAVNTCTFAFTRADRLRHWEGLMDEPE